MNVVIVAPSSVPFSLGGAENLWCGLLNAINTLTPDHAELIKLPVHEHDFWSLIQSYHHFYTLDLSHFDMVVSGKYPAWMVRHPQHICYMLHRLRGLYDTYHYFNAPLEYVTECREILALQQLMRTANGEPESLPEFFERIFALQTYPELPDDATQFPGPFIREIVHFLDGIALSTQSIRKYAAISKNLVQRQDYFPDQKRVDVIHPASSLSGFYCGESKYLFTASRLDKPKRIDLLIQAMRHVKSDIDLLIAGVGSEEHNLKELAQDDSRIKFVGFVSDEELIGYYANALAVLFMPYDEDYGYITVEAMMSGKPVITTIDSGGPNEFVSNGQTGFSVEPSPEALAQKIEYLCQNPDRCREMGENAKKCVEYITWENVVSRLLDSPPIRTSVPVDRVRKKNMTVVTTYPIYPPRGGGQNKVYHFFRHLAQQYEIEAVTLGHPGEAPLDKIIASGFRELRTSKTSEHAAQEWEMYESKMNIPLTDVLFPLLYKQTPDFLSVLKASVAKANIVVTSHPYPLAAIREVYDGPVWYEIQDVEYDLKRQIFPDNETSQALLELIKQVEGECCTECELLLACSQEVSDRLEDLYDVNPTKIIIVPNGVDLESVTFTSPEERQVLKTRMGYESLYFALMMGSWHEPNLEAVRFIVRLAKEMPDIRFLIVGSSCSCFENQQMPENVLLLGVVDDEVKNVLLGLADVALNPMMSGSGTNMKVLDYMAAGIPVLSTEFGVRGLKIIHGVHAVLCNLETFQQNLSVVKDEGWNETQQRVLAARELVEVEYSYSSITQKFRHALSSRISA